jgi:membrane protease YdiL (CAAX protease family)
MTASPRRLRLWQASLWVLLGGALAQFAGALTAGALRSRLTTKPLDPGALQPNLVVPALVASAGSLLLVALVAPLVSRIPLRHALNLRPAPPSCFIAAAIGTVMLGPTADACMRAMETLLPQFNLGVVSLLHDLVREIPVLVAWPAFALLPGVAEESMFRGLLQTSAGKGALGIVVSALAFSLFHIDPHHVAGRASTGVLPGLGRITLWNPGHDCCACREQHGRDRGGAYRGVRCGLWHRRADALALVPRESGAVRDLRLDRGAHNPGADGHDSGFRADGIMSRLPPC